MSEFIHEIDKEVIPRVDKHGFTIKPPITDNECILSCLKNPHIGLEKKQVDRLVRTYENIINEFVDK